MDDLVEEWGIKGAKFAEKIIKKMDGSKQKSEKERKLSKETKDAAYSPSRHVGSPKTPGKGVIVKSDSNSDVDSSNPVDKGTPPGLKNDEDLIRQKREGRKRSRSIADQLENAEKNKFDELRWGLPDEDEIEKMNIDEAVKAQQTVKNLREANEIGDDVATKKKQAYENHINKLKRTKDQMNPQDSIRKNKRDRKREKKGGNKTQKIRRKKGRKSQNKRKKGRKGSKKRHKRPHRNTRKIALKIEN